MKSFIFYLTVVIALSFMLGVFVSRPLTKKIASSVQHWRKTSEPQLLNEAIVDTVWTDDSTVYISAWFNYKTKTYDWIERPPRGKWRDYIPQDTKSLMLFDFYLAKGMKGKNAVLKVCKVLLGEIDEIVL